MNKKALSLILAGAMVLGMSAVPAMAEEKPFDCSIWPLRIIRVENKLKVALTPTCPAINKVPLEKVKTLVKMELGQKIHEQAQLHPDMVKEFKKGFIILE